MGLELIKWEEHFESLPPDRRTQLYNAIKLLESDPVFYEQYRWTGLFVLATSIVLVEDKIKKDQALRKEEEHGQNRTGIQKVILDKA